MNFSNLAETATDAVKSHPYITVGAVVAAVLLFSRKPAPMLAPGQKSETVQLAQIQAGVARSQINAERSVSLSAISRNAQSFLAQLRVGKQMQSADLATERRLAEMAGNFQMSLEGQRYAAEKAAGLDYYAYARSADLLQADTMRANAPYQAYQQQWMIRHGFGFSSGGPTGVGATSPAYGGYGGGSQNMQYASQAAGLLMSIIGAFFGGGGGGGTAGSVASSGGNFSSGMGSISG